jgi:hypothetical protein
MSAAGSGTSGGDLRAAGVPRQDATLCLSGPAGAPQQHGASFAIRYD